MSVRLELRGLAKDFAGTSAVDGIDLTVEPGGFCALIGPSGCGKTTTLRLIAGLEIPTSGQILLNGSDVSSIPPRIRRTPLVWQSFALFPHLTVRENVEFGLRMAHIGKDERRERSLKVLDYMGLVDMANRPVTTLSGGQKQRVGLARALIMDSGILLLDEPLGSLDANLRIIMQTELKKLQKDLNLTFIYVTHNQSEALAMADQIVVMNNGRIEQEGSATDVYLQPKTRFVAEFVGASNIFTATVAEREQELLYLDNELGRFVVAAPRSNIFKKGDELSFVVQASRMHSSNGSTPNSLSGKVMAHEFMGALVTTFVELTNGEIIKLQRPEVDVMGKEESPNETIAFGWRPEDVHLLPRSQRGNRTDERSQEESLPMQ